MKKIIFSGNALKNMENKNGIKFLLEQVISNFYYHLYIYIYINILACSGLNRCRKSCRLRWLNYLKPNIKRGEFTEDEVDMILRLHKLLGNRWSLIAGRLPGRTANDVKNYWNTHLRRNTVSSKILDWKGMKISTIQNTKKINVIKPQPWTFSKKASVRMNLKITMELENKRELLGHPNLYKKAPLQLLPPPSLSMDTPDNEIMWWERLLQSGEFVQQTPATTSMIGWSDGTTVTNFWTEQSPQVPMFAGSTCFEVDKSCFGKHHHDMGFDADLWNLLNTEEENAI
ncbi:hypothetical protein Dsin_012412 [Dipteronia sinensis]|uniref:Uncharacterized protein n=1 Tax=Dipteronia sinensis TaxID=43782 RepID=A0AAE0AJB4_9ROSI|nr:hypothetical protein Dsin_012412 [Dipteronia sinensis]